MIKKILPISIFVLLVVIIILLGLQNLSRKNNSQNNSSLTPTLFQGRDGNRYNPQTDKSNSNSTSPSDKPLSSEEFQKKLPIAAPDFTIDYSPRMQKYVVTLNADAGEIGQESYVQWLEQNAVFAPLLQEEQVIIAQQTVAELHQALDYANTNRLSPEQEYKKNTDTILSIVNTLFAPITAPTGSLSLPTIAPTLKPTPPRSPTKNPTQTPEDPLTNSGSKEYTYYAQCGSSYSDYLLPVQNGTGGKKCTICYAGCGPTTASMILSSYVDKSQTPPKVVDAMGKAGVEISCNGSGMYELYDYMGKVNGIKVSSLMDLGHVEAKEVVGEFRNYIKGGWTLFVLADCKYGGHYFWVTDVTADGKILSYDPAYGAGKPTPFNENQYDPHPYYIYAFAVKKS